MVYIWLIVFALAMFIELCTTALVSVWFAVGALFAMIFAGLGVGVPIQCLVFVLVTILFLVTTRSVLQKLMVNCPIPTNVDLLVGKTATVTETFNSNGDGRVVIGDVYWAATTDDTGVIVGDIVQITAIKSTKLVVSKETATIENVDVVNNENGKEV